MNSATLTLSVADPQARRALATGWIGPSRVVARRLIERPSAAPDLVFERLEVGAMPRLTVGIFLQTIRAFSLTATGTPFLAVLLLSLNRGGVSWSWGAGALALIGVLLFQIAINLFNDVEDYRKLIDLQGTLGGSGAIQNGWMTPVGLTRLAWLSLLMGIACGLPAVLLSPAALLPVAALGTGGVLMYSARRLGLKYIALGDVAVFILCGPALTQGFALSLGVTELPGAAGLGAFFGFLAVGILHVNNLQDLDLDRKRGALTLAGLLGFTYSIWLLITLYVLAAAVLAAGVALGQLPVGVLLGLVPLVGLAAPWLKQIRAALGPESSQFSECRVRAAQIHLASGLGVILGLALTLGLETLLR